jgi:hypothetical protein
MHRVLEVGGTAIISTRDYDEALREQPRSTLPSTNNSPQGRVITFQLWDWTSGEGRYTLEHFQMMSDGDAWTVHRRETVYYAIRRGDLTNALNVAGFREIRWYSTRQSGFHQPLVCARV